MRPSSLPILLCRNCRGKGDLRGLSLAAILREDLRCSEAGRNFISVFTSMAKQKP